MASAPAAIAAARPRASVIAADLHERAAAVRPRDRCPAPGTAPASTKAATRARTAAGSWPLRISSSPTSAASKPSARQRRRIAASRTPDSAIDDPVGGDALAQPGGELGVDRERPQVAVVDADEPRVGGEGGVQLARVVRLDERLEAEVEGGADEAGETARRVEGREQQDGVRAGGPQHGQLPRVHDELLGQDRQGRRGAGRAQVVDRAAEPVRFSTSTEMTAAPPAGRPAPGPRRRGRRPRAPRRRASGA